MSSQATDSVILPVVRSIRPIRLAHCPVHQIEPSGDSAGKAHAPYEFGVKVSLATTLKRSKGGQFALHAKALPWAIPDHGHTLQTVIPDMERTIGNEIERLLTDAGYRGHNEPDRHRTAPTPQTEEQE